MIYASSLTSSECVNYCSGVQGPKEHWMVAEDEGDSSVGEAD